MEASLPRSASFSGSSHWLLEIPVYVYAVVFSSLCVITGLIWDICWHQSIGRDGLFSPPHLIIYVGAVVSGLFSGYEILRITFFGQTIEKQKSVQVWGFFHSSLGAIFCVWGAIAMITSAPFDDWWHGTYGLDVQILSPPHTVLALGIIGVQFGAIVSVLALKNQGAVASLSVQENAQRNHRLFLMFALSGGFLLTMWFTLLSEDLGRWSSHESSYYKTAAAAFPFVLIAFGRAISGKWTMTAVAGVYMTLMLLTLWVIPLFPAEPKLGPVLNHIDHYQGFAFPLLLVVPALALDWLLNQQSHRNDWILSVWLGVAFLLVFFVTQWFFGGFLHESPLARNWFFGSHYSYFANDPTWEYRYKFGNYESTTVFWTGMAYALLFSVVSARVGLAWGKWMSKVQR